MVDGQCVEETAHGKGTMDQKPTTTRYVTFRLPLAEVEAIEAYGRDVATRSPGLKVDRTAALRMLYLTALRNEASAGAPRGQEGGGS